MKLNTKSFSKQPNLPEAETFSTSALKFVASSATSASNSKSDNEEDTSLVTVNEATSPVIEGAAEGMVVVGAATGEPVGFEVTKAAQKQS